MANKPDYTVKVGSISLAVWTNTSKDGKFDTQSITITRTYKKGTGFDTTNSLRFQDLSLVKLAIDEALKYKYLQSGFVPKQDTGTEQVGQMGASEF